MTQATDFRDYNREVYDNIVARMAMTAGFEPRRQIFRAHIHRAFEPQFFPSLIQLTLGMAAERNEKDQMVMQLVFAAGVFELRDFLGGFESKSLNPTGVALDLLIRPLAAALDVQLGLDATADPGAESAKAFIRHRQRIANESDHIFREIERMASAAEDRSHGDGGPFQVMRDITADFRDMPRRMRLMGQLLRLAELEDGEEARRDIQSNRSLWEPPEIDSPMEPAIALGWITEALEKTQPTRPPLGFERLVIVMLEEGVGVAIAAIDDYLTRALVPDSEAFDEDGNMIVTWPGEESARHELASCGPAVVVPALRTASRCLKSAPGVVQIFGRVSDLLLEVIDSSDESRNVTSGLLVVALAPEQDPDVRALATLFCGLNGVNPDVVKDQLTRVFVHDDDPLVKVASASVLVATPGTPDEVGTAAISLMVDWLRRTQPPELLKLVLGGSDADAARLVISLLPGLIAERSASASGTSISLSDVPKAPAPTRPGPPASETSDAARRLRLLEELVEKRLISEEEYQSKRMNILDQL
jgi:hypothetical protein